MKKSLKTNALFFTAALLITLFIYSCSEDTTTNTGGSSTYTISGTITFADTLKVDSGGSYNISAFNSWFPTGQPNSFSILNPVKVGNVYTASYTLSGLSNGYYFLASAWTIEPYTPGGNYVLGSYGCDTNGFVPPANCRPDSVVISGSNVTGINFYSYIDTNKSLINF
ncbi:MAG: hypothetical protein L0Y79_05170 [Chlorobi bacterium]|nr:hypothetical protein [Chlorobiota bacterium]MCI0715973.1 hypothetical protein [Chlorobiota bacterium]